MDPVVFIGIVVAQLFGSALLAGVAAYFGAYLGEKGKSLAIQEDLRKVVGTTEEIKRQLAGGLWKDQETWKLRAHQGFLALLEFHRVMIGSISNAGRDPDAKARILALRAAEEARLQLARARVAVALTVSPVVVRGDFDPLDDEFDSIMGDQVVWRRATSDNDAKKRGQITGLALLGYEWALERATQTAAEYLHVLSPAEIGEFEQRKQRLLDARGAMHDLVDGKDVSPDALRLLDEVYPGLGKPRLLIEEGK